MPNTETLRVGPWRVHLEAEPSPEERRHQALLQELAAFHGPRLDRRLQLAFLQHRQRMRSQP